MLVSAVNTSMTAKNLAYQSKVNLVFVSMSIHIFYITTVVSVSKVSSSDTFEISRCELGVMLVTCLRIQSVFEVCYFMNSLRVRVSTSMAIYVSISVQLVAELRTLALIYNYISKG